MKKVLQGIIAALIGLLVVAANAAAEFALTPPTVDITALGTMCTTILAALASVWLCRKAVKMINRS